jgi:hypothetical protein
MIIEEEQYIHDFIKSMRETEQREGLTETEKMFLEALEEEVKR